MQRLFQSLQRRRLERFADWRRKLAASSESLSRGKPAHRYRYVRWKWRAICQLVDAVGYGWQRLVRGLRRTCSSTANPNAAAADSLLAGRLGESDEVEQRIEQQTTAIDPRRILVVQLDHLGDAILSTGLLRGLRRRFPAATIDVLAGEWNRELFAACPEIDSVLVSAVNRFARGRGIGWIAGLLWWGWTLRRNPYDLAIEVRGELPLTLLLWLSGAKRRVGWTCGGGGFLLTDTAEYQPGRAEAASRQALLDVLGIDPPPGECVWPPRFVPDDASRRWAAEQFSDTSADRPLVVCHLGAGTSAKRWPVGHWRVLQRELVGERRARVVLIGGHDEGKIAAAKFDEIDDRTGQLSLNELAAVLERADLLVGADSGPAHLAAAVGTPVVALFSGTNDPRQWQPWGPRVEVVRQPVSCSPCHREACPLADHPCMSGLTPQAVLHAVGRALDARSSAAQEMDIRPKVCP